MTIDEIKELIQVVNETGIAKLMVQRGENTVEITRAVAPAQDRVVPLSTVLPVAVSPAPPVPSFTQVESTPLEQIAAPVVDQTLNDVQVSSPIVGTYYDAPAPDAPKFVRVGDRVEPKQVLCIIESMKLMNEIEAEISGTVVAKYIENGRPVEYGEALFAIRPSKL